MIFRKHGVRISCVLFIATMTLFLAMTQPVLAATHPSNPSPIDGAIDVPRSIDLSWDRCSDSYGNPIYSYRITITRSLSDLGHIG